MSVAWLEGRRVLAPAGVGVFVFANKETQDGKRCFGL